MLNIEPAAIKWIRHKRSKLRAEEAKDLDKYLARDLLAEITKSPFGNYTFQKRVLMDAFGKQPDEFEADVSRCFVGQPETIGGTPATGFDPITNYYFALGVLELHVHEMINISFAATFDDRTIDYLDQLLEQGKLHQKFFPPLLLEFGRALCPRSNRVDLFGRTLGALEMKTVQELQTVKRNKAFSVKKGWIRDLDKVYGQQEPKKKQQQQSDKLIKSNPEPKEETDEPNADLDKSSRDEEGCASADRRGVNKKTRGKNNNKMKNNEKKNKQKATGK